jgi:hypothetical protein
MTLQVAQGVPVEKMAADYEADRLPDGFHSTLGKGKNTPDPTGTHVLPDGVTVPMGRLGMTGPSTSSLLYDEIIVYNTAQVRMRYLLKVGVVIKRCSTVGVGDLFLILSHLLVQVKFNYRVESSYDY